MLILEAQFHFEFNRLLNIHLSRTNFHTRSGTGKYQFVKNILKTFKKLHLNVGFDEVIIINELAGLKLYKKFKIKHSKQVAKALS